MKKIISILLLAVLCLSFVSCGESAYDKYVNAELESNVTVEMYVQATQSWWDNKITVYAADEDGAYFVYELACSEEDSKKLTPGTKIKVTGRKTAWEGEVEIMDATFEFAGDDTYVAEAVDLTKQDTVEIASGRFHKKKGAAIKSSDCRQEVLVAFDGNGSVFESCHWVRTIEPTE